MIPQAIININSMSQHISIEISKKKSMVGGTKGSDVNIRADLVGKFLALKNRRGKR